ncbi:MAG: class I SAM-dependent methyltransferase [Paracoccaceae bacterium]|nr:class I SAM-dependent methyltransferase [Paracoccaceae bacterium]
MVRLRPKTDARRLRHGYPWVWADQLVTDRRTKALSPGTIATLEDAARTPLATVAVTPGSKIIARVLDRDPEAAIDESWLAGRIARATALRDRLYRTPYWRWIHAEADGLPGVVIDRFGDVAVCQPNAAWADALREPVADALVAAGATTVVVNAEGRARALEGLPGGVEVVRGRLDGPLPVEMNGATYIADLLGGQKTGLFYDQRDNHAFAARFADGVDVLDVFSHVGGFGLAAVAAGATSALLVDASEPALALARQGADRSGAGDRVETRAGDGFDVMAALAAEGRRFGLVISDPPAFAPAKPALQAGLRAYEKAARLAAALVAPGGVLVLCSCSHAADLAKFRAACVAGIGRAGRSARLLRTGFAAPDHPELPALAESGYLKALTFALDG